MRVPFLTTRRSSLSHHHVEDKTMHVRRAGSSGGGGGARGGGGVSSSGSGSGRSSGSSGSSSSGVSRGGVFNPPSGNVGRAYGSPSTYGYGYGHPNSNSLVPVYGYWPIYWNNDSEDNATSTDTRPGGPLIAAAFTAATDNSSLYAVFGDTQSVNQVVPFLLKNCTAVSAAAPNDLSKNSTVGVYRDESFDLLRFNGLQNNSTQPSINATLESCLNQTLVDNLPIMNSGFRAVPSAMLVYLIAVTVGFNGWR